MKKLLNALPIVAILTVSIFAQSVWADSGPNAVNNSTSTIEQRLNNLEQQIAILKRQLENNKEDTKAQTGTAPVITANSKDGFSIKSPDGNYSLKLGGYTQVLAREFADNKKGELGYASSIIPRRVRLVIQGTVAHDFDYYIQPEFGYSNTYSSITATAPSAYAVGLQDAWLSWKYFPWATIKAGKFKTPFDLENLQDTRFTAFPEIGLTSNLSPQRDVGVQLSGSLFDDVISYAGGFFDGAADKENSYGGWATAPGNTNEKSGTGRVFFKPFKKTSIEPLQGLGIGYAASYGKVKGSDIPSYISPGQAPVFTYNSNVSAAGNQLRTSPQAFYYYKSLGLLGEMVNSQEELQYTGGTKAAPVIYRIHPTNRAWEATGSYVLTGEDASYTGVTPRHDFDLSQGHWGAFELVGRYGELRLNSAIFSEGFANLNTSISKENTWGTGINWYLNRNVKVVLDFEQTKFRRGAPDGASTDDRKTENLYTGMFQLGF